MLLRSSRPTVEHASSRRTEMPGCHTRSTSSSRIGLTEFLDLSHSSHVFNVGHPIAIHTYSVIHYVWWRSSGSLNGSGTGCLRCITSPLSGTRQMQPRAYRSTASPAQKQRKSSPSVASFHSENSTNRLPRTQHLPSSRKPS